MVQRLLAGGGLAFWLDFFHEQVGRCGPCGLFNLCGVPTASQLELLDPLFAEALQVWGRVRRLLGTSIGTREQVLAQPLKRNPCLPLVGRLMAIRPYSMCGFHQVRHLVAGGGGIDGERVTCVLRTHGVFQSFRAVARWCSRVEAALPGSWVLALMRGSTAQRSEHGSPDVSLPEFHLLGDGPPTSLAFMTPKKWYQLLIQEVRRPPTAEVVWGQLFPGWETGDIWCRVDLRFAGPAVFATEFKIRHRRIFTGVVLSHVDAERFSRVCAVCGTDDETLEHLFLRCPELVSFWVAVCSLLARCCAWAADSETGLIWTMLFGLPKGARSPCPWAINIVMALARQAVYRARNYRLFGDKVVQEKLMFNF
ncbi:uncharacterized protein LOC123964664 [Micropterus dolomieu]|uniref:uncharacterized protein LOC123964664 n=1 Tax=Micropterus dolomieu TaxID=147949 RepID=UPI001E8E2878|nr:uncharacterized protein LOC123964664 [Micropterus dolomieu]